MSLLKYLGDWARKWDGLMHKYNGFGCDWLSGLEYDIKMSSKYLVPFKLH